MTGFGSSVELAALAVFSMSEPSRGGRIDGCGDDDRVDLARGHRAEHEDAAPRERRPAVEGIGRVGQVRVEGVGEADALSARWTDVGDGDGVGERVAGDDRRGSRLEVGHIGVNGDGDRVGARGRPGEVVGVGAGGVADGRRRRVGRDVIGDGDRGGARRGQVRQGAGRGSGRRCRVGAGEGTRHRVDDQAAVDGVGQASGCRPRRHRSLVTSNVNVWLAPPAVTVVIVEALGHRERDVLDDVDAVGAGGRAGEVVGVGGRRCCRPRGRPRWWCRRGR